jgi:uncharacterized protein (DUF2062 family)
VSFGTIVRRRLAQPILDQLRQGLTPSEIALAIGLGFVLSVPPVLGSTIVLCGLAAILLRLNQPVIQTVNFAVYPLQLALLVPYVRLGEWIFGASRTPLSPGLILSMAKTNFLGTIATFWTATWHGVVAWAIVTPPVGLALFFAAKPMLERAAARMGKGELPPV